MAVIQQPLVVHEATPIFRVLDSSSRRRSGSPSSSTNMASLEGIVTQTDLLEAIAGDLPGSEGEEPDIVERDDGSLLIDGMMPAHDAFERLGLRDRPEADFHTLAGFALCELGHLPRSATFRSIEGWRFEIVDMDGRRIDKLLVSAAAVPGP